MTIPLWIVLVPFGIFLFFFLLVFFFNLFHILHYTPRGLASFLVLAVSLSGTALLLGGSYVVLSPIDWTQTLTFSSAALPDFFTAPNLNL
jgi:hypothetical protein